MLQIKCKEITMGTMMNGSTYLSRSNGSLDEGLEMLKEVLIFFVPLIERSSRRLHAGNEATGNAQPFHRIAICQIRKRHGINISYRAFKGLDGPFHAAHLILVDFTSAVVVFDRNFVFTHVRVIVKAWSIGFRRGGGAGGASQILVAHEPGGVGCISGSSSSRLARRRGRLGRRCTRTWQRGWDVGPLASRHIARGNHLTRESRRSRAAPGVCRVVSIHDPVNLQGSVRGFGVLF